MTGSSPDPEARVKRLGDFLMFQGIATLAWFLFCAMAGLFLAVTPALGGRSSPDVLAPALAYGVFAVCALIVGTLQVAAAVQLRKMRGRFLAFAALLAGVVSFVGGTVCCLPTALVLAGYGAIVLMDEKVGEAFEARG